MTAVTAKRFSIAEYHRLAELGFFEFDNRFELIRGEIIKMAAKGRLHSVCNSMLFGELYVLMARRACVRGQEPIILPTDSEPEPDVVIARSRSDNYVSFADYWIFNLVDIQLEMHSEPYQKQRGGFDYRVKRVVLPNEVVVIPGFPELSLDLSAVFPAQMGE
ncbi:MAG: Uma2 family endonuclease [Microcoleus sp. PH2017_16_JOR_D_A]|uniref:Uma2 family endonuclease n=1 Tax=Microcoleus sp. PH2017_16_JOR_D_A TaxID=2798827 RepID=UPI001D25AD95|nr:Uma2 family endonuclease [Microcoleus sp. PH2017_16_JOR_D_A]MCC3490920.1 Uma2 family endonuclease [Microcoleus sp. PH2017_16_JOR_D_A]